VIASLQEAQKRIQTFREEHGGVIVFTNGCFDLLQVGHVTYLEQARAMGDLLVVGLNTDLSVKAIKGPKRPIQPERDRAGILAALRSVDIVVLFDEETPIETIKALKPDIHVKGGDYDAETLPEFPVVTAYGGTVKTVPLVPAESTTSLIDKIQQLPRTV